MARDQKTLETRSNRLYDRFRAVAARFGYRFSRPAISVSGKPNVVFLGNHSSGKSTFINHLLDGAPVQDTGVAPTDDGFTVILYDTSDSDVYGPAALARLPAEYGGLASLGSTFLQRLRVKFRNCEVLKSVNLIDSPGMVDAARSTSRRDYDFMTAIKQVSEISDLVLFMFDPDKPGTTGETVDALSKCLVGMEFKLRILLNKCDTFDSMYDFARAYGALCWNLGHVLNTKDLPTVYTTYLPVRESRENARLDLTDFDRHRGMVTAQIQQASHRRADNLLALVQTDFSRLSMQVDMISAVRRRMLALQAGNGLAAFFATLIAGAAGVLLIRWRWPWPADASFWNWRLLLATLCGLLLALLTGTLLAVRARRIYRRTFTKTISALDELFPQVFAEKLAPGNRNDLEQQWQDVREPVQNVLVALDKRLPAFPCCTRWRIRRVLNVIIPAMAPKNKSK